MTYTLQYFDEVEIDIQEAKVWYKEQQEGLEIKFTTAIETAIKKMLQAPKAYAVRYNKVRIAHPKRSHIIFIFILMNLKRW